ncbi:uncharacterized protein E6C27_scaffold138G001000 [Cucumis melo var. makuwa]|uniref:Uncharacterized protein n=1 Tax=Cucumis melo var. makuwa TaxID=1194695 RepID=A0A5A7VL41_CUCMM|nr:uncharacterized protein E6C27_scaffold138G001000 [Cucumis melo var. makuwa]
MPNSFGSLTDLGKDDDWALAMVDDMPPPLQVVGVSSVGFIVSWRCEFVKVILGVFLACLVTPRVTLVATVAIRWHLKAFSGAPVPNGMREFGIAIREVDLVKPSVQVKEIGYLLGLA